MKLTFYLNLPPIVINYFHENVSKVRDSHQLKKCPFNNGKVTGFHFAIYDLFHLLDSLYEVVLVNGAEFSRDNTNYALLDCEALIFIEQENKAIGLSFADLESNLISLFIERNSSDDKFFCTQYTNTRLYSAHEEVNEFKFQWFPLTYYESNCFFSLTQFYTKRLLLSNFTNKIIFRKRARYERGTLNCLNQSPWFLNRPPLYNFIEDFNSYFEELIYYKVGLSIAGLGEICYRDIEYMAIGLPMLRLQYITNLNPPLIPNVHYISIDRPSHSGSLDYNKMMDCLPLIIHSRKMRKHTCNFEIRKEQLGGSEYAVKYIERFLEVKDDLSFLQFISKNARAYYEKYLDKTIRAKYLGELIGLL